MEAQLPLSGPAHPSFRPALMQCESSSSSSNLELNLRRPRPQAQLAGSGARGPSPLGY